jgi:actin-binding LIM protein
VYVPQKEEEELSKIETGMGKVFLQNVREREKLRQWKLAHLDPRNASRTPSAAREPAYRLRYESPVNACKLNSEDLVAVMKASVCRSFYGSSMKQTV